jgi:hypothetical protein
MSQFLALAGYEEMPTFLFLCLIRFLPKAGPTVLRLYHTYSLCTIRSERYHNRVYCFVYAKSILSSLTKDLAGKAFVGLSAKSKRYHFQHLLVNLVSHDIFAVYIPVRTSHTNRLISLPLTCSDTANPRKDQAGTSRNPSTQVGVESGIISCPLC